MWLTVLILVGIPVFGFLAIPLLAIWTHHKRKMEELAQRRQQTINMDLRAEFDAVRAEIRSLRDTTMQYDLSFDATLQNLELRMVQLERQSNIQTNASGSLNGSLPSSLSSRSGVRPSSETGITQNLFR